MKTCKLIIATQHKNSSDTIIYNSIQKLKKLYPNQIYYKFYLENVKGLSELYQSELDKESKKQKVDYLIFVHDDVEILDMNFLEKLEAGFRFNDVIGLAGATKIDFDVNLTHTDLMAWHKTDRQNLRGSVAHAYKFDLTQTYFNTFGPCGSETTIAILDGLFIGIKLETCANKHLFDSQFKFHFYDFSFSLQCHLQELRIICSDIIVYHHSHGDGLISEEYKQIQKQFKEFWIKEMKKNGMLRK